MQKQKIGLLVFLLILSFVGYSQTTNKDSIYLSHLKHVYTIKILGKKQQTAFKIQGFDGLITTLHGFYTITRPGIDFKNYRVTEIRDYRGQRIYNERNSQNPLFVQKVDLERDLAFIRFSHLDINEGFSIGSVDSVKINIGNGLMYNSGNSYNNRIKPIPITFSKSIETFNDQIKERYDKDYYSELQIPSLECKLLVMPNTSLFPGNSGSPIVNSETYELLAIAQAANHPNWSWGIIPNIEKLNYYEQLSKKQINKLDSAYIRSFKRIVPRPPNPDTKSDDLYPYKYKQIRKGRKKDAFLVYDVHDTIGVFYKKYAEIKARKSYPFIKTIPLAYNLYINTGYNYDIKKINNLINPQPIEDRRIKDAYFKIRKKNWNYIHSRKFISVASLYSHYMRNPDEKKLLEKLINEAQELKQLADTTALSCYELKLWKRSKLDFNQEVDSLLELIASFDISRFVNNEIKDTNLVNSVNIKNNDTTYINKRNNNLISDNENYKESIKLGDNNYNNRNYEKAYQYYTNAIFFNNDAVYPKEKLSEIDLILRNKIYSVKVAQLDTFINSLVNKKIADYSVFFKLPNIEYIFSRHSQNNFNLTLKYGMLANDFRMNSLFANFPSGKYKYFEGDKAIEIISLIIGEIYRLYGNIIDDNSLRIKIIGHADGIPYNGYLRYDDHDFGNINNEIVKDDSSFSRSFKYLINGTSSEKNRALAFLRAFNAKHILTNEHSFLLGKTKILSFIHSEKGGMYRYVEIILEFSTDINKLTKP